MADVLKVDRFGRDQRPLDRGIIAQDAPFEARGWREREVQPCLPDDDPDFGRNRSSSDFAAGSRRSMRTPDGASPSADAVTLYSAAGQAPRSKLPSFSAVTVASAANRLVSSGLDSRTSIEDGLVGVSTSTRPRIRRGATPRCPSHAGKPVPAAAPELLLCRRGSNGRALEACSRDEFVCRRAASHTAPATVTASSATAIQRRGAFNRQLTSPSSLDIVC